MRQQSAVCTILTLVLLSLAVPKAYAAQATYSFDNLVMDDGNALMSGTFTWTYTIGDFENGVGQFTFLDIPYTWHNHTDLDAVFDVGNSIEITLDANVHDDGVDITIFLLQPLTPTSSSAVDLSRSKFDIGGNGFHTGVFVSGNVVAFGATGVAEQEAASVLRGTLTNSPNPFRSSTDIRFSLPAANHGTVEVFEPSGRLVRTLAEGYLSAGTHVLIWDGRNQNGRRVPAGVYLARVRSGNASTTHRLVLLH